MILGGNKLWAPRSRDIQCRAEVTEADEVHVTIGARSVTSIGNRSRQGWLLTAQAPVRNPLATKNPDNQTMGPTAPRRILIVDDDVRLTTVMGTVLELAGYTVLSVHSAEEALGALRGDAFHLIVLDVMLPGVDGVQVCRHLRENGLTEVPVLLCTALTDPKVINDAESAGVTRVINKPFTLKAFTEMVGRCLGESGGASSHNEGGAALYEAPDDSASTELTDRSGGTTGDGGNQRAPVNA